MAKPILTLLLMLLPRLIWAQVTATPQNWRDDLRTLTSTLPVVHPNLYFQTSRSAFDAATSALNADIPDLSDAQIIVRMAGLVATVGDAHTNLSLTQTSTGFRTYPLRVQWFDEGLFVIAALPGVENAIGKRIVRIDGMDIQEAYNRIVPLISAENDAWRKKMSQDYLVIPEILTNSGVVANIDSAAFEFQDSSGLTIQLQLQPYRAAQARNWIYVPDLTSAPVPLYRKQNNQNYWFQYLSDSQTLYFKYNACVNSSTLTFAAFTDEFLKAVDAFPIARFVFDFRNNGGGDSSLIQPLLGGLQVRYSAGQFAAARLYVIVGKDTISSSLLNALDLKNAPVTTIVGEATGGKPNHYGNIGTLILPRSGLRVSYSTRFFASPITTDSLIPDILVSNPAAAFFRNRDPFMEALMDAESTSTSATSFVMYNGGGTRAQTGGAATAPRVGYGKVESTGETPFALGVLQYRVSGVLVSEASIPPSIPMTSAITYVEVDGRVNTGVAIANTSAEDASIEFSVTDETGTQVASGTLRLAAGEQIARFLNDAPFNVKTVSGGALRVVSSVPVSILTLRGYSNERSEFLLSTLAVVGSNVQTIPTYCAHFADGDGWTTQLNLVNPTDSEIRGSYEFVPGGRFTYILPPYSARHIRTSGAGVLRSGFIRITPDAGLPVAAATALFGYRRNGITVTEASVHALPLAETQSLLVSGSGGFAIQGANALMSGIGIVNPGASEITAQLSLVSMSGAVLGSTSVQLGANIQRALFLDELFQGNITFPLEGTLRITSTGPIAVTGLRGQYNERGDFLISATPVFDSTAGNVFAHVVDGGGYSTRFLFVARNQPAVMLRFLSQSGSPLSLDLR